MADSGGEAVPEQMGSSRHAYLANPLSRFRPLKVNFPLENSALILPEVEIRAVAEPHPTLNDTVESFVEMQTSIDGWQSLFPLSAVNACPKSRGAWKWMFNGSFSIPSGTSTVNGCIFPASH